MIERVRSILNLPEVQLHTDRAFGSKTPDHRMRIRESIFALYPASPAILNLDQLPNLQGVSVSISHTQTLGGYALSPGLAMIGFDLDLTSRISSSHLQRVSRYQQESKASPGPEFLWTAKEASFKAVAVSLGLRVLADVVILNWVKEDDASYFFEAEHFKGVAWSAGDYTYAISRSK